MKILQIISDEWYNDNNVNTENLGIYLKHICDNFMRHATE